jgi:1-acyl-sn-glycerol-3-phosphate acyltransferase
MLRPTPEQLSALRPMQRLCFAVADFVNQRLKPLSAWWVGTVLVGFVGLLGGRRFRVSGLEHLQTMHPESRAVLVANHRSFFDFHVISCVAFRHSRIPRRAFWPVRATFFYDSPVGLAVAATMSGLGMFPPILRSKEKGSFNQYAVARLAAELVAHPTTIGIHPEGTRNQDRDPWSLLRGQSGVGRIALACENARVVPIFVKGMSNDVIREAWRNFTDPEAHPIDIVFGPDIAIDDLRPHAEDPDAWRAVADRCMDAIRSLADGLRVDTEAPARKAS